MLDTLSPIFEGELYYNDSVRDRAMKSVYATDASVYQEHPMAVAVPKTKDDIISIIKFANELNTTIIPRAAGTSLAGQVVGNGIVVDISKYFTKIIEINPQEKWVRVQPGVIRDDLNAYLKPYGLMFGPETSTSSRAMIGGMIGNNSSGLHSIIWGDTRANVMEIEAILYDGTEVLFEATTLNSIYQKPPEISSQNMIYHQLLKLFKDPDNIEAIKEGFPKKSITRRNTGYALDAVLEMLENNKEQELNLCKLIAGSEGTLCFITGAKLKLIALPPKEAGMVAIHTSSIHEAMLANRIAMQHSCSASELVDDFILQFTKTNIDQSKNRFFIVGDPKAILMVEFFNDTVAGLLSKTDALIADLKKAGLGYAFPVLLGEDTKKAWELRKAGLGLLRNLPGDTQAVNLIEDCAVDVLDLPDYIAEVEALLKKYELQYSMYAHAGAGEIHVEPMINLKTTTGKNLFRTILAETARIVKKYKGSLSGEHGDGRLRGEFIPFMMGDKNYQLFQKTKHIFDPKEVFNKGKIVNSPPMNESLRFVPDLPKQEFKTIMDFSYQEGILRLAEKCSGSGDCRKTEITGGTMCPSYMATRSERDTTRARANMLRHFYTNNQITGEKVNMEEVKDVLELCLSCKGCKSECPSGVDVGKMKAEFTQLYHEKNGVPFQSRIIGNFANQMKLASKVPALYNFIFNTPALRKIANKAVGFHPDRSMPLLHKITLMKWWKQRKKEQVNLNGRKVLFFCDEFTNYNDVSVGQKCILLLERLGYEVEIPEHIQSGRTYLSKGMVKEARKIALKNIYLLHKHVNEENPIIGVEPSALLTLRDEYLDLIPPEKKSLALMIAKNTFLFEEWFARELELGFITRNSFNEDRKQIKIHGHCHQKALSSLSHTKKVLSLPKNYEVRMIPSGCCGMAGSFGYEKEHYEISMKIGELVLFPAIKNCDAATIIAAPGTSCRHQIKDGTGRQAKHPAEILFDALV